MTGVLGKVCRRSVSAAETIFFLGLLMPLHWAPNVLQGTPKPGALYGKGPDVRSHAGHPLAHEGHI